MIIDISYNALEGFVHAWLTETLEMLEEHCASEYAQSDTQKDYRKDIKAAKRLLEYLGH